MKKQKSSIGWAHLLIRGLVLFILFSVGIACLLAASFLEQDESIEVVLRIIGGFLSVSVTSSIIYSSTLRKLDEEKRLLSLTGLIDRKIDSIIYSKSEFGLDGIYPHMDYKMLFDSLEPEDELWWLDTYAPGYQLWIDNIEAATKRGANINMLVLEPRCDMSLYRADEMEHEDYSRERFNNDLQGFLNALRSRSEKSIGYTGKLNVTTYSDLLGNPSYIICRKGKPIRAFSSFYLTKATGTTFPHFKWISGQSIKPQIESDILNYLYDYVRKKWERNNNNSTNTDQKNNSETLHQNSGIPQ